jgi:hypothetical protein
MIYIGLELLAIFLMFKGIEGGSLGFFLFAFLMFIIYGIPLINWLDENGFGKK